jgi:uncharacterized membrane protein SirB2
MEKPPFQFVVTTELVITGVAMTAVAVVLAVLGEAISRFRTKSKYRKERKLVNAWSTAIFNGYLMVAGGGIFIVLAVCQIGSGISEGWLVLLMATLFVYCGLSSIRFARKRKRPRWLEIAFDREQRERRQPPESR